MYSCHVNPEHDMAYYIIFSGVDDYKDIGIFNFLTTELLKSSNILQSEYLDIFVKLKCINGLREGQQSLL